MNISGKYITVWKIDKQANYTKIDIGEGEKKYQSDEYENWSFFGCFLAGNAKNVILNERDKIEIKSGKLKMQKYNDKWSPAITIFELEVMSSNGSQNTSQGQYQAPQSNSGGGQNSFTDDSIPF